MTKLFSMKSLAFAGAAAFAVALAAAPQADAAEKLSLDVSDLSKVKVTAGGDELSETADGKVIYYQLVKDANTTIKDSKYVAIADEGLDYYNLSSLGGKAKYLSISPDGTSESATGVAIKAAPKLKATYDANGLTLEIGGDKQVTLSSEGGVSAITATTSSGEEYAVMGVNPDLLKSSTVLGNTLEVTVKQTNATDGVASVSKVAKLKIAAKAKAPKISLKLDATKAFTWKIAKKQEFRIKVGENETAKGTWKTGSDNADSWATIVTAGIDADAAKLVTGDAIMADVEISLRTGASGKKSASALSLVKLDKSAASPTSASIVFTDATYDAKTGAVKKATSAAIKAGDKDLQYSTDNGVKWKKLAAGKDAKLKANETSVLVRTAGESKNKFVLPSLNTTITIDPDGSAVINVLDYDTSGSVVESVFTPNK